MLPVHSYDYSGRPSGSAAAMPKQKEPYILEPADQSAGRPATFIFLHGFGDDAQGTPLGLAQQFQMYQKLPYLRWVLPNAPHDLDAMAQSWYMPKALPNAMKPPVPGEVEDEGEADDEAGIMKSVEYVDKLVEAELEKTDGRVVVGGFSQGCAISLVWGLTGRLRERVAGVVGMSGHLPLAGRLAELQKEQAVEGSGGGAGTKKKWLLCHGTKDMMVPVKLFGKECEELSKWIDLEKDVKGHVYEGLSHSTNAAELRDILGFLEKVVPA